MSNPLRERRPVTELAGAGQVIEFAEHISSFDSLAEIVQADLDALDEKKRPTDWRDNVVSGTLRFDFVDAASQFPKLVGSAATTLAAVCQRCLEPFELELQVDTELLLLDSDKVAAGYEEIEVWELDEPGLRAQDIVEELLIMAMPLAAMHDNKADCKALLSDAPVADESDDDLVKPFAALRSQMQQNEKDPET